MTKKLSFDFDYTEDFQLLGIVTQFKDYRLAFFLNNELGLDLKKYEDLKLSEKGGKYSWYRYIDPENDTSVFLLANYNKKGKLVPNQNMDFFLLIKNMIDIRQVQEMIIKIRKISEVLAVYQLELNKIKNAQLILEAVEMHELEQEMKSTEKKNAPENK